MSERDNLKARAERWFASKGFPRGYSSLNPESLLAEFEAVEKPLREELAQVQRQALRASEDCDAFKAALEQARAEGKAEGAREERKRWRRAADSTLVPWLKTEILRRALPEEESR